MTAVHDALLERFEVGDKLVYLGNYTGHGTQSAACVDEILTFRRLIMSLPGARCSDLSYLRGGQEEMLQKLLQLQFAPNPSGVFLWMLSNGLSATLQSYGLCHHDGLEACQQGIMSITKWTGEVRARIRARAGHDIFSTVLSRAAFTEESALYPMLFVNAGIDTAKALDEQGDCLWWSGTDFVDIHDAYDPFKKVVRGYDPQHKGLYLNCVTATLDGGCGFGGELVCAGFSQQGEVFELLEA
ncbi:MAG: hypothetical protein KDJ35_01275 [Alphaproteobacteria bacterium]|nr:hypothetical protein [Alphaproteobacteria bacterium]